MDIKKDVFTKNILDCEVERNLAGEMKYLISCIETTAIKDNKKNDVIELLDEAKKILYDKTFGGTEVVPVNVFREVFKNPKDVESCRKLYNKGYNANLGIENRGDFIRTQNKKVKIVTDTGIEITLPSGYLSKGELVKLYNVNDDRYEIVIKNIFNIDMK